MAPTGLDSNITIHYGTRVVKETVKETECVKQFMVVYDPAVPMNIPPSVYGLLGVILAVVVLVMLRALAIRTKYDHTYKACSKSQMPSTH
jgi:hypothetical protein